MSTHAASDVRRTFAVLGTNGKATTCYVLEHLLAAVGRSTAIFGSVETKVASERVPVGREVTPDLGAFLVRADAMRIDDSIVELSWSRVRAGEAAKHSVDVAAFTGADPEAEGDDLEQQLAWAKAALNASARPIILVDDEAGARLAQSVPGAISVGTRPHGPDADWQASINATRPDHIDFSLTHRTGRSVSTSLWLPARFSVGLAALAMVMAMETGINGSTLAHTLPNGLRPVVPGRMERVADHPRCIVDIAHTGARLARALEPLRKTTKGKLLVIVAARPEDSMEARHALGRAAAAADSVVVTDDDFGIDDDAAGIRADVIAGVREAGGTTIAEIAPRRAAIRGVVALAGRDDTVLVAGRGHLGTIAIAGVPEHLDDREEVRAGIAQREQRRAEPE